MFHVVAVYRSRAVTLDIEIAAIEAELYNIFIYWRPRQQMGGTLQRCLTIISRQCKR